MAAVDAAPAAPGSRRPLRWGFMSTANIGTKNAAAIARTDNNVLFAVASRDKAKAEAWARKHGAEVAYGSYDELLADARVDAVYIPLPCALHHNWVLAAARARKHVLVEKPVALTLDELKSMVKACRDAGVQWMDGTMFSHHERMSAMKAYMDDETVLGKLRSVHTGFSFMLDTSYPSANIRASAELEPHGVIGDLGWYNIRLAMWAFEYTLPARVRCVSHVIPAGVVNGAESVTVPMEVSATLSYSDGRRSTFGCSFLEGFRQWAEIVGTKGRITLDDFVIARSADTAAFDVVTKAGVLDNGARVSEERLHVDIKHCCQEAQMFRDFADAVASGARDRRWPMLSLVTQAVLDACMRSLAAGGTDVAVEPVGKDF